LDGKVSAVVGTHTHIPTADTQIFPGGTGYQTDAGMCGDYNSVIGMDKTVPVQRFRKKIPTDRMQPASGPGTFCGTLIELNDKGLCIHIEPVRCGPRLMATH
jgi:calcineurin-like phosphoesterase